MPQRKAANAVKLSDTTTPAPVTIVAPDVPDLQAKSALAVTPAIGFCVVDNDTFIEAGQRFNTVAAFIASVEAAFKGPKSLAYQTHRSITALEASLLKPALQTRDHLAEQQLGYRRRLEDIKRLEEQRLQAEQQAAALAEHNRRQAILDAETAERQKQIDAFVEEAMPWERVDPITVERIVLPEPEVPLVRLPSAVPFVAGGPSVRNSPWMAKVDLKALVSAAAQDDQLLQYLEAKLPLLNAAAREHGQCVGDIIPGVTAYKEERLARG